MSTFLKHLYEILWENRNVLYPPKDYQEKLRKFHGKKVKVLVVIESA